MKTLLTTVAIVLTLAAWVNVGKAAWQPAAGALRQNGRSHLCDWARLIPLPVSSAGTPAAID